MPVPDGRQSVVVVGAGITGMAAAWELAGGPAADGVRVTVLEAGDRLGGKLQAVQVADRTVDVAADAFVARRPEATTLVAELGIADELVEVATGGASVFARGRLRPLPAGLALGVPTRWWPLARSGILSPLGSLRAALDLVIPARSGPGDTPAGRLADRAVGDVVGGRLGRGVVDRLADPLIGGINAGSVDQLSAAAAFPGLVPAAARGGSLMRALRSPPAGPRAEGGSGGSALFATVAGGTNALASALAGALGERGVALRTGAPVAALDPKGTGWRIELASGEVIEADGVIVATPAPAAASLLDGAAPDASALLAPIEYASVTVVTLVWPEAQVPTHLTGTGFLVPRTERVGGQAALITGCTYLDRKWPLLRRPGEVLLRASVGRFGDERAAALGDDELVDRVTGELVRILGVSGTPTQAVVTRWPDALPQYRPGHLERMASLQLAVARVGTLGVAGAFVAGVGIPACIGSGRSAARDVRASMVGERR
ncbi:MAG: protoporphyrinogen oxidase [Actinomycetota bacterium]|nr:protoporphyrinogen oxidase [Actinomycetota bacterium]